MDNLSIAHTRWNCTYHIVFIPKYRRKIMYGELKRELAEILKKLCEMKQVRLIEGKVCVNHVHMSFCHWQRIFLSGKKDAVKS